MSGRANGSPVDEFLSTLSRCTHLSHIKQLQARLLTLGHGQSQLLSFKLFRFCDTVLADLPHARLLFRSLHSPNIFLYTAIITAHSTRREPLPVLHLFLQMLRLGRPKPNEFIYPHVVRSYSDVGGARLLRMVDAHVRKKGFHGCGVVRTALVDGYSRCGELEAAQKLFDGLRHRNVVSWTAMVAAYMRDGMVGNAVCLFDEMPERDLPAWNAVIVGCARKGFFGEATDYFRRLVLSGLRPNQTTVVSMSSACGHFGMLHFGKSIHGYVYKNHIGFGPFVCNALIDMYGKCGNLKEAKWVFDNLSNRGLAAWNSMINCLALHGRSEDAITLFKEMEVVGLKPDEVTFVGVLNACMHGGSVEEGKWYFHSLAGYGIVPCIEHYGCMIDLLGRAGRFDEAVDVINGMDMEPDKVVWGSLLNGCRIHWNDRLAEIVIQRLLELDPTSVDYGVMLANLYSERESWEEVGKVRKFLKETGRNKTPGCSWVEANNNIFRFYSGDKTNLQYEDVHEILGSLEWATTETYMPLQN